MLTHLGSRSQLDRVPKPPSNPIQDISVGTVLCELGGPKAGRMAACHVRYNSATSLHTVYPACASFLQAVTAIADAVPMGHIDPGILSKA